ncbi:MAG TPA: hypothetical protein VHL60_12525, partial [Oxalicibacterium sp.]|nr:hypothetical protein [Oxalicibacterium sp.]
MRFRHSSLRPLPLVIALQAAFAVPAYAQFAVTAGQTDTVGKTLTNTNGSVDAGGALLVSGSTVAVTVGTGTSTINNAGTIRQTGTARGIDLNANSTNLTLNNSAGALIDAVGDVTIRVNKASDSFVINNQGTISQSGVVTDGKTYAIKTNVAFTTTGNQIINGSASNTSAVITSSSSSAIKMGANTTLTNYGQIYSTSPVNTSCPDYLAGCSSGSPPKAGDGVSIDDAMKNAVILNHGAITGSRHGVDGGDPVSATADADLIGIDQLIVTGIGTNGVTFDKVVNGVTTSNVQVDNPVIINYAGGTLTGNNGSGVGLDGHGVVINYGTISGKYAGAGNVYNQLGLGTTNNGDGDGVDIDGVAYIENYGVIQGLGAGGLDSGGQPNGADGIAAGGGTIINHANATIYGQSHAILIDDGADGTAVASGRGTSTATGAAVKIINDGNITAGREVAIGLVGNFNDTIVNNASGTITGGPDTVRVGENNSTVAGAAIQMGDGDDSLTNYGRIEGKNGLAIDMGNGNDTLNLYGGTVIGTIDGGAGTNTLQTNGVQVFESGQLSNFQNIAVQGGSTTFNYGLGTVNTVDIANAANLRVNGAFGTSGNLNVSGTLQAPTSGAFRTIQVGGNYTQGANGVLEARIGANGTSDQIAVSGNATLSDGATIRPLLTGAVSDGATYTLVTAGSMTASAAALQIDNGSGLFFSYTLQGSGNDLQLVAHQNRNVANTVPTRLAGLASALGAAVGGFGNSED